MAEQLDTMTSVTLFKHNIKDRQIIKVPKDYTDFTCGAFMAGIQKNPHSLLSEERKEVLISFDKKRSNSKLIKYWIGKLKELGIDSEYWGEAGGKRSIMYHVNNDMNNVSRLAIFSLLRYLWITPYKDLIEFMYDIDVKDNEDIKEHGYWGTFMRYHFVIQSYDTYSNVFGFANSTDYIIINNEEFKELLNTNEVIKYDSINNRFNKYNRKDSKTPLKHGFEKIKSLKDL